MSKWLFIGLLLASSNCLTAQLEEFTHLSESEKVKQAPHYRFPAFQMGDVIWADGKKVKALLNYNLATEEMVVDLGHRKMPYTLNEQIQAIVIDSITFRVLDGQIYEELYFDTISLLVHGQCRLQRLGQNTGLGRSGTISSRELPPAKDQLYELDLQGTFEDRDVSTYFLQIENQLHPIDKPKDLMQLFPAHTATLKKYLKKSRTKMRRIPDLLKLAHFLNQL